jgi:hypothetical protein
MKPPPTMKFSAGPVHVKRKSARFANDLGRTRTCNPRLRGPMPYPLGHEANWNKFIFADIWFHDFVIKKRCQADDLKVPGSIPGLGMPKLLLGQQRTFNSARDLARHVFSWLRGLRDLQVYVFSWLCKQKTLRYVFMVAGLTGLASICVHDFVSKKPCAMCFQGCGTYGTCKYMSFHDFVPKTLRYAFSWLRGLRDLQVYVFSWSCR